MADTTNITNSTNSLNKSSNDVQSSIDKLSTNMKRLVAIQMTQLVKDSSAYADNIESAYSSYKKIIDLETKHISKLREENRIEQDKLKIEEKLIKLSKQVQASDEAKEQFEKRIDELRKKRLDTEEKLLAEINKLRKEGFDIDEDEISNQEELISFLERRKNIFKRNVEITKLQSEELKKQIDFYKRHGVLLSYAYKKVKDIRKGLTVDNILNKTIGLTKGWLSQLASFASFGKVFDRVKTAAVSYQDNMWGLGQSLKYTNDGFWKTAKTVKAYDEAVRSARMTAAKFGADADRVLESMNQLSSKVLMLKKVTEEVNGKKVIVNRYDYEQAAKVTGALTAFARTMRMDVSEAIDMYSESIRKFGMSNTQAMGMMSEMQAQTITFNDILGESAVFADEVGKEMLELQQGTRHWVQDLMMMNTQFNSHINLLIKQGKSQKEALALAKNFQKIMTEPTSELTKYNVGRNIRQDYHKAVEEAQKKGLSEEEQIKEGARALGLLSTKYMDAVGNEITKSEYEAQKKLGKNVREEDVYLSSTAKSKAETIYGATIKDKKFRTEKGESDYFAEVASQTSKGVVGNIQYWLDRFDKSNWGLEVAQKQGFGDTIEEAAELERMLRTVKEKGWDKEEGLSWEKVIRRITAEKWDEQNGGLTKEGEATQKLLDSFDKLSDEEKKKYIGDTKAERAKKYRDSEIKKAIQENNNKKEDNRQFDALGKINESNEDIKKSVTSQMSEVIQYLSKIEVLLAIGAGASALNFGLSGIQTLRMFGKGLKPFKLKGGPRTDIPTGKAPPKATSPKAPIETPKVSPHSSAPTPTKGSVSNAKQMTFEEWNKSYTGNANRADRRRMWREATGSSKSVTKSSGKVLEKASSEVAGKSASKLLLKEGGKLGAKATSKLGVGTDLALGAGFAMSRFKEGDIAGGIGESISASAPYIGAAIGTCIAGPVGTAAGLGIGKIVGLATDGILALRDVANGDKLSSKQKEAVFKEFSEMAPDIAMMPENINKAIDDYVGNGNGMSEEAIADLKASLKESYDELYKESLKSNTKDEQAIMLQQKLSSAEESRSALMQEQINADKEAYSKLDDLGKLLVTQEKMFDMHKRWFSFNVETETRKLLDDKTLTKEEKFSRLKGMKGGSAGAGLIKQSVDASGVTTWKIIGNDVVNAANATGM